MEGRNNALKTTLHLIIDDGFLSRKQRANIFDERFNYVGISSKLQNDNEYIVTVQDFYEDVDEAARYTKGTLNQTETTLDKTIRISSSNK